MAEPGGEPDHVPEPIPDAAHASGEVANAPETSESPDTSEPAGATGRHAPWAARVSIAIGVVLIVLSVTAYVGGDLLLKRVSNSVQQQDLLGTVGAPVTTIAGPVNILLVGLDTRDTDPGLGSRSDSIIIVHIPASHDRAYLISIPRDTNAVIPPFAPSRYPGGMEKINAAYQEGSINGGGTAGGVQLLALTIQNIAHITFNAAVVVDFDGFRDVVAALGGVNMCVDERTTSIHYGFINGTNTPAPPFVITDGGAHLTAIPGRHPMVYEPGCQHLSPTEALDYVRQRDLLADGDGDYGRQRHQQQFVKALLEEGINRGLSNPLTLEPFLTKLSKAFVFDGHGVPLTDWIFTFKSISPSNMILVKTNAGAFNTVHIGGESREVLSPLSLQLLSDVNTDSVDQFIAANPAWVSPS